VHRQFPKIVILEVFSDTILKGLPKVKEFAEKCSNSIKTTFLRSKFIEGIISGVKKFTQSISGMFSKQVTKQAERITVTPNKPTATANR
jgi:hypothetical protein